MKIILLKVWKYLPYKLQLILSRRFVPLFQVFTAAVILNSSEEILLVRLTYQRKHPWGLPGGNLERGEEPETAVAREIREETGFEISVKRLLLARNFSASGQIGLFYECEITGGAFSPNEEVAEIGYFHLERLPAVRVSDVKFLKQLMERVRPPSAA